MWRFAFLVLATLAAPLAGATRASAQEAIPTATGAPTQDAPPPAAPPPPLDPIAQRALEGGGPLMGPCGPLRTKPDGSIAGPSHQGHGEVMAGVGTAGYREAAASVCQPIGDNAVVNLNVGVAHYGR